VPIARGYYGWTLLVALGGVTIIAYGTMQYSFGVLVVPVGQEMGWNRADLSGSYSIALVVAGLLGYPIGRWIDRYGARAVMATGSVIGGLALIRLSGVHDLWQWDVLWGGGLGVAGAMTLYPVSFAVVANWFHRRRGSAMAVLNVLGGLASPIYIPLAGWLVPQAGWRETLVVLGLTQWCIALPLVLLTVRRHPEDMGLFPDGARSAETVLSTPRSGVTLRQAMRRSAFWTLMLANGLSLIGSNVLFVHQIAYMIGRGESPAAAATLAGLIGVASLPGRYVFNTMSDRFHSQSLLAICQATLALGVVVLARADSTGWLIAYIIIYGAAFGAAGPLFASVRAEHFGRRAYATISAVQGLPALGAALGPVAAGWLYDRTHSYQFAFAIVAALYVVSAVAMVMTPKPNVDSVAGLPSGQTLLEETGPGTT
jgi:MFS family permease